jgi:hypothetical protein
MDSIAGLSAPASGLSERQSLRDCLVGTGTQWYTCNNGFKGCCSENPCDGSCPDPPEIQHPFSTFSSATTVRKTTSTSPATSATASATTSSAGTSTGTDQSTISPTSTLTELTQSGTSTAESIATPSDAVVDHRVGSLSSAAVAGISVGGTLAISLVVLIAFLLLRRRRIMKRMSSIRARPPDVDNEPKFLTERRYSNGEADVFAPFGGQ